MLSLSKYFAVQKYRLGWVALNENFDAEGQGAS